MYPKESFKMHRKVKHVSTHQKIVSELQFKVHAVVVPSLLFSLFVK